ncbi:cytosolic carboxypeptidase Nna1 isoform X2 [Episyrphus balteatus]|uniref:cytosolic carboxypeptidase Nna1 isoform X2 n=1 Tax=Episyrphus balteatus TaxID=286459 RepID=UPI002486700F|nr:cytosolic carboxypeptidase Nna1 isoform X2 [Episyrphus balteatus]
MNYLMGSFLGGFVSGNAAASSSVFGLQGRVQVLQAQLFPVCPVTGQGFLSNFLSKGLKTNQLEVNTDEKTLKPIARLKEPRDLFALPKDKDNDCSQQAARWPTECQVLDERIQHIAYVPVTPEAYNQPTGNELKPRPVGEENGIVVYNYNPVSAVNYKENKTKGDDSDGTDSDISSSESRGSSPERRQRLMKHRFSKMFNNCRSSSNSNDENDDEDDEEDDEEIIQITSNMAAKSIIEETIPIQSELKEDENGDGNEEVNDNVNDDDDIDDIWGVPSPYYSASPTKCFIQRIEAKPVPPETILPLPQSARLEIFSRSSVGGSKFLTQVHPFSKDDYDGLWFESRFESGNLAKAVKITETYYELYLRPDLYTSRSKQWFYFRVGRTKKNLTYRFSIVNLVKSDSLYNEGMRPLMYSTTNARVIGQGWRRCGENICYYRNDDENSNEEDEDNGSYTLTFNIEFPHDDDTVYFAHSYPYTYTDLQDYLMAIQKHPVKSKFCKLRLLCRSLAGNNVYYLTVTAPTTDEELMKKKKAIVVSARVHPSETPSSWMMKGLMDFITGDSSVAKRLRHKFIFKLIPMLNPDGVIVGNTRNSLTGKDLNRQYRTVIRETYPSIWYTKAMIKRLIDECGVAMYCDMHAHSRRQNIFVYGCENRRNPEKKLTEQVFPLMMHKNVADKFSFENCKFKIQRSKEGTGRIVVWMLGVTNSYTIEASFGGSSLGSRKGTHFSTGDYEHMGRAFCETLLDYCDENPNKERLRLKIIERLLKEGSSADEPLNIPLSDYSSDEGDTSSSSDNEGKADRFSDLEGPCCQPLKAPPCSPEYNVVQRRKNKLKIARRIMKILDGIYFRPRIRKIGLRQAHLSKTEKIEMQRRFKKIKKRPKVKRKMRIFLKNQNVIIYRKVRKKKQRSKSSNIVQRNKRDQRTPLDMPTTDPGSDLFFSTDDEIFADGDAGGIFSTVPRSRRYLLQSDLQRRYIDTICDGAPTPIQRMPPELIVTPAKQGSSANNNNRIPRTPEKPKTSQLLSTDFPPVAGSLTRRTNSWHNLHSGGKYIPKLRVQNVGQTQRSPNEDIFSLKKKIWTGCSPEVGCCGERSRPLSWAIPPIHRNKEKHKELDEHEALFAACSQKLVAWQQETVAYSHRNKLNLNLVNPELSGEKVVTQRPKKTAKSSTKLEIDLKVRKKKSNFMKITETSRIINCFAKASSQNTIASRKTAMPFTPNASLTLAPLTTSSKQFVPKKFKTGGLVATAVQTGKKSKRQRSSLVSINKPIEIPLAEATTAPGQLENEKSFARKVRTKLKKKKSVTSLKGGKS